jgi:hypothetical protein
VDRLQSLMKDHNAPQSVLDGTVIGRNCSATATRSSSVSPTAGAPVHPAVDERPLFAQTSRCIPIDKVSLPAPSGNSMN